LGGDLAHLPRNVAPHRADKGIRRVDLEPRTSQLNGTLERSHTTHKQEFYQLLSYKDDVDLDKKLAQWTGFYNDHRSHGACAPLFKFNPTECVSSGTGQDATYLAYWLLALKKQERPRRSRLGARPPGEHRTFSPGPISVVPSALKGASRRATR
jgi:hypothetical protein